MNRRYRTPKGNPAGIFLLIAIIIIGLLIWGVVKYPIITFIILGCAVGIIILIIIIVAVHDSKKRKRNPSQKNITKNQTQPKQEEINEVQNKDEPKYNKKEHYLTKTEINFFHTIQYIVSDKYITFPQVPLSQIVEKNSNSKYQNELYRIIDICIFSKENYEPLLCIEINDNTHHQKERYLRDLKVKEILRQAEIPIIILWTEYGVNPEYIKKRINDHIKLY